jgi:hypothetical protein
MAEYSRLAKGNFISSGQAQVINLPFQPDYVRFTNYTLANTNATSQNVISAFWDVSMGQGQAVIQGYNATPALIYDVVSSGGISTFSAGQLLQYGPSISVTGGITKSATTPQITSTAHGLSTGQWVVFQNLYQTSSTGMQQIAGIPFQVTVTGANTFTINWNNNGSNYTAITGSGFNNAAAFKQILYPSLYVPGVAFIGGISGSVVTTTAAHNYQVGQQVAFHIPPVWGPSQLNALPDNVIPGQPVYYYVTAVTLNTFTIANAPSYNAFNPNQPFSSFPGEQFPQVVAVGDVNSGGWQYNGGNLYPSPQLYNNSNSLSSSINGPAIQGAFINNTSQGFIIGIGPGRVLTTAVLVGASTNQIFWEAVLHDYSVN